MTEPDEIEEIIERQGKLQEELIKIEERKKNLLEGISVVSGQEKTGSYTDMNPIPGSMNEQKENKKGEKSGMASSPKKEDRNGEGFQFHLGAENGHREEIMRTSSWH